MSSDNSDTNSIYSNIFTSKKKDKTSIAFLNTIQNDFFYEKNGDTLEKVFFSRELFDFELYIMLMLIEIKLNIIPEILEISDLPNTSSNIKYDIENMISLREAFKVINFHYLVNELLSFLKVIQSSKLLIGNLNIDTIYVKKSNLTFYIIDFSKCIFTDRILDLDFQSLYISLNENNNISQNKLNYFNEEFTRYTDKRLSKESFIKNIIDLYTT